MGNHKEKCIVVAIYTHPELYPPLLNAVDQLSGIFDHVYVLTRNLKQMEWQYPHNVQILTSGKLVAIRDSEKKTNRWKIISFLRFTYHLFNILRRTRPVWLMCNDPISLLAFRLVGTFIGRTTKLWYQNHDVAELNGVRKFSIGYFAVKSEIKSFKKIELFTLPSESRMKYFPLYGWKGNYFLIPNYPLKRRMQKELPSEFKTRKSLKLIYQGRISNEHGLEEIINYLQKDISLTLTIIGPGDDVYKKALKRLSTELKVESRVAILDPIPYKILFSVTQAHDIGLAINKPINLIYSTGAQASNKIYEYASAGLPILYYDNPHYREYLNKYKWAFPTDLSDNILNSIFDTIKSNYYQLSKLAKFEFENNLNYECAFEPVGLFLKNSINI